MPLREPGFFIFMNYSQKHSKPNWRLTALCASLAAALSAPSAYAQAQAQVQTASDTAPSSSAPAPAPALPEVVVTVKKLGDARSQLLPETGSTAYRFNKKDIDALPLGSDTALNQVILQAPGVVQDSYGQLHVRGDHANLQYRIDGVIIPEPMTGFGQALSTRIAKQINILTGALPAEYGYRTAGIVDIQTKASGLSDGGSVSLVTGTNHYNQANFNYGGSNNDWSYFFTGSYLQDNMGIENPSSEKTALHDKTKNANAFGYVSRVLDSSSRISLMFGDSNNSFQIPDVPGQMPQYSLAGVPFVDSSALDANQNEKNQFQVLSYQNSPSDQIDYQVSLFHRITGVHYNPDPVGDLVFNGVAATIERRLESTGVQSDWSYRLNDAHTLRAGIFVEHENFSSNSVLSVFQTDNAGNVLSNIPTSIPDGSQLTGGTYGGYLQDEWRPTKNLTINYGARYDKTTTVTKEQQFSPRLGLVYDVSPDTRFHAGYSRYFTPPPTEIIGTASIFKFQNTTNALSSNANTSVMSERSNYFDLGLTHKITPEFSLGLDAYYRDVKNLQDEGQFGSALIYSAFNYEKGRVKGLELSTSYKHENLSAYANISRSQAMGKNIVTGQYNFNSTELAYIANNWIHLDHDQKLSANAGVSYKWGELTIGGDLIFGSGLRAGFANTDHLPAYTQVNLSTNETFHTSDLGTFNLRLAAINVFDKVYEIRDGSGVGVGAPQYGPRRGLFVGFEKSF